MPPLWILSHCPPLLRVQSWSQWAFPVPSLWPKPETNLIPRRLDDRELWQWSSNFSQLHLLPVDHQQPTMQIGNEISGAIALIVLNLFFPNRIISRKNSISISTRKFSRRVLPRWHQLALLLLVRHVPRIILFQLWQAPLGVIPRPLYQTLSILHQRHASLSLACDWIDFINPPDIEREVIRITVLSCFVTVEIAV